MRKLRSLHGQTNFRRDEEKPSIVLGKQTGGLFMIILRGGGVTAGSGSRSDQPVAPGH